VEFRFNLDNPRLNWIMGDVETVILGDNKRVCCCQNFKTVCVSKGLSVFSIAIELRSREEWVVHDVRASMLLLLNNQPVPVEMHRWRDGCVVAIEKVLISFREAGPSEDQVK